MRRVLETAVLIIALLGAVLNSAPAQAAGPLVKRIETESQGNRFVLRVFLNTRLAPRIFALGVEGGAPRVVVDFNKAARHRSVPLSLKTDSPLVRSVRVGIHKGKARKIRLVLDLVPGRIYQVDQWFRRDLNAYILVLQAQ